MNPFDIFIAYVSWNSGGKRRPVLILGENPDNITAFKITTQYEGKSEAIRARYFIINDWQQAGLDLSSYVDTNNMIILPESAIDALKGRLSAADERQLIDFITNL